MRSNDQLTRLRLLDILTPAVAGSEGPAPCLGPQASAFLASRIPVGTQLRLTYQSDQFGQTAATASTSEGTLINAEIARAGFVEPAATSDDGNDPTLATVRAAAQDAVTNKRGLHSPDLGCAVPGQVKTMLEMVAKIPITAPTAAAGTELTTLANTATTVRAAAEELLRDFTQNRQDLIRHPAMTISPGQTRNPTTPHAHQVRTRGHRHRASSQPTSRRSSV